MNTTQHLKKDHIMKHLALFLFAIPFCFFLSIPVYGQKSINLIAGVGYPELINIGARYNVDQGQWGASVGYGGHSYSSYNAHILFHFGKESLLSSRKPWYVKWNYTYFKGKNEYEKYNISLFGMRLGREFNITQNFGFALDGGMNFTLSEETIPIKARPPVLMVFPVDKGISKILNLTSIGINTFIKL
jgi:hypothetical protein